MGIVTTQEITIFLNNDQSTTSFDLIRPTNTTDPTLQCVVLTGIPKFDASRTVRADPISIAKPLEARMKKKKETLLFEKPIRGFDFPLKVSVLKFPIS